MPADCINIIKKARPVSEFGPYNVYSLFKDFFRVFAKLNKYKSIRPDSKTGDPTITDIVVLHNVTGKISYTFRIKDD